MWCAELWIAEHMAEFVEIREVIEREVAPHIIQIAQKRRAGHRHKDRIIISERQVFIKISQVIGERRRYRFDQFAHQPAIQMHPFTAYVRTGAFPVDQCALILFIRSDLSDVCRSTATSPKSFALHSTTPRLPHTAPHDRDFLHHQTPPQGSCHRITAPPFQVAVHRTAKTVAPFQWTQ